MLQLLPSIRLSNWEEVKEVFLMAVIGASVYTANKMLLVNCHSLLYRSGARFSKNLRKNPKFSVSFS